MGAAGSATRAESAAGPRPVDRILRHLYPARQSKGAEVSANRISFQKICEELGIPCLILHRRATENYLAEHAIKRIKSEKYKGLGEFELLEDAKFGWGKHENWRIAREMRPEDLEDTDLGKFLTDL